MKTFSAMWSVKLGEAVKAARGAGLTAKERTEFNRRYLQDNAPDLIGKS